MSTEEQKVSLAQRNKRVAAMDVSVNECQVIRHLHADGWTYEEIKSVLGRSNNTVALHLNEDCYHPDGGVEPEEMDDLSGEEILEARRRAGKTQVELADELGVAMSSVSQWESGQMSPTRMRAREIKHVFEQWGEDV